MDEDTPSSRATELPDPAPRPRDNNDMIVLALVLLIIVLVFSVAIVVSNPDVYQLSLFRVLVPVTSAGVFFTGFGAALVTIIALLLLRTGIRRTRETRRRLRAADQSCPGQRRRDRGVARPRPRHRDLAGSTAPATRRPRAGDRAIGRPTSRADRLTPTRRTARPARASTWSRARTRRRRRWTGGRPTRHPGPRRAPSLSRAQPGSLSYTTLRTRLDAASAHASGVRLGLHLTRQAG